MQRRSQNVKDALISVQRTVVDTLNAAYAPADNGRGETSPEILERRDALISVVVSFAAVIAAYDSGGIFDVVDTMGRMFVGDSVRAQEHKLATELLALKLANRAA